MQRAIMSMNEKMYIVIWKLIYKFNATPVKSQLFFSTNAVDSEIVYSFLYIEE
jgi:hypothetical protein